MSHSLSVNFFTKQNENTSTEPCEVANKQNVLLQVPWKNDPLPTLHPRVLRHSGPWRQYFFLTPLPGTEVLVGIPDANEKCHTEINRIKHTHTHCCLMLSNVHINILTGFPTQHLSVRETERFSVFFVTSDVSGQRPSSSNLWRSLMLSLYLSKLDPR